MPYENEHSARLKNPKDFEPKSFRRTNGGTIYGSKKVPKTIAIIWAKLQGKSKPKDPVLPQALRFPTKSWSDTSAKAWLKKNNVKYQKFEPAKAKEKQAMADNTAPVKACIFNEDSEVSFAEGGGGGNNFRILGYSGKIIKNHWYWGNLAIDLAGLKFYKKRVAVLESHFSGRRIGFTTKQEIKDAVRVEGEFLDSENAQQMKKDIQAGFPMEASLFCPPSVIEHVLDGASVKVNGHVMKGPGAVFREAIVKEVSMCVFGLDTSTKSSAFAAENNQEIKFNLMETNIMAEETQTVTEIESVESFAQLYPEFYKEIFEKGKTEGFIAGHLEESELFASLKEACGDDHELLVQCFSESKTAVEAMKLRSDKLGKENTQLSEKVTELQKDKPAVEAAQTEFSDTATAPGEQTGSEDADVETLKKEFAALSADDRAEFGDVESYVAFKQADAEGQVRMVHRNN